MAYRRLSTFVSLSRKTACRTAPFSSCKIYGKPLPFVLETTHRTLPSLYPSLSKPQSILSRTCSSLDQSSSTPPPTDPLSNSSSSQPPIYTVAKICKKGTVSIEHLSLTDILKGSSMHVRDLFSLALTSNAEHSESNKVGSLGRMRRKRMRPPAAILPRRGEIIMSFGNIRALISSESGMIFDAHEKTVQHLAHSLAQTIALKNYEAKDKTPPHNCNNSNNSLTESNEPFELLFLEQIFRGVCDSYNRRLTVYQPIVHSSISQVTDEFLLSESGVHRLVPIKDSLQQFEMRLGLALDCVTHLLQNDEDMLGLLLEENRVAEGKGEVLDSRRHESVELMLEEYARQLKNVKHEVNYLLRRVQSKQEMVAISLDAYRNKMISMSLTCAIASLGFATSTTVAGFFGMNLIHGLEEHPTAFTNVITATSFAGAMVVGGCMAYISGPNMKRKTMRRLEEFETIERALTNMGALDYTVKKMVEDEAPIDKEKFKKYMTNCPRSVFIEEKELDFLFDIFDLNKDGLLYNDDFRSLENVAPRKPPKEF